VTIVLVPMADIPSLSSGQVGSRFVSQNDLETARARRDEQWKAAYARLGQEPPKQQQDDAYDGRSLAEVSAICQVFTHVLTLLPASLYYELEIGCR
jgi:hypothetical protein